MSSTFRILHHGVGEGARRHGIEVKRIQQLLQPNGFRTEASGVWHSGTTDALVRFQDKIRDPNAVFSGFDPGYVRRSLAPNDRLLFELAYGAHVLIRLSAGGKVWRHALAFEDVHQWCEEQHIGFDMNRRAVWGFDGYPTWAIMTESDGDLNALFDTKTPRALNCTLYANLMMSVWKQGNAHRRPFMASVKEAGGLSHFAQNRYGYPLLGKFESVEDIRKLTNPHPHGLYCVESGKIRVNHLGLLYKDRVYECNLSPTRDVHSVTLDFWAAAHPWGFVLGPAPA